MTMARSKAETVAGMSVYQHVDVELRGCEAQAVISRTPNANGFVHEVYYLGVPCGAEFPACAYEPDLCRHDRHFVPDLTEVEKKRILDVAATAWDVYWICDDVRQARSWCAWQGNPPDCICRYNHVSDPMCPSTAPSHGAVDEKARLHPAARRTK
jgi:hypothetical protein